MASIFLSYGRDDARLARPLAAALEKAGHSVWWDQHIGGGSQYAHEIEQALNSADVVMVLWSKSSIDSAWVRDEAGSGRDRDRLVQLSVEGTAPPLGFRQFQAIDLGRWSGRGKVPRLDEIFTAVERQSRAPGIPAAAETAPTRRRRDGLSLNAWAAVGVAVALFFVVVGLLIGRPWDRKSSNTPTLSVTASDNSQLSQSMARNLLAKLGALQGSAAAGVRLVDASDAGNADMTFSINGTQQGDHITGNVALLSGADKTLLWSKDFEQPVAMRSAFDEAVASAAGRVLGCALQETSGQFGRLQKDLRSLYLNACATLTEAGYETSSVLPQLRHVVNEAPKFRPAWAKLLLAESTYISSLPNDSSRLPPLRATLRSDIAQARKLDTNMAEATLAELELDSTMTPTQAMALADKAKAQDPENPLVLAAYSEQLQGVGRMAEAMESASDAARLDPLSPNMQVNLIIALAFGGQIDRARIELARAKRLWSDTDAIKQVEFMINLRFGDFEKAIREAGGVGPGFQIYANARRNPTDANMVPYMAFLHRPENAGRLGFGLQGLGEANRPNEFYQLMHDVGDQQTFADDRSILFRPYMAPIWRDPRFMPLMKQLGLVDYWQKSGHWPDFCADAHLRYDCKAEAAKLS
jgi:tetratricopeptide (TPR) repeat protein